MTPSKQFYAYIHCRSDGTPFYVGKGHGRRAFDLRDRSDWHKRITTKLDSVLIGKMDCSTEALAFELEKGLIKCLRRMGVSLCNMTDGGEGSSGHVPSPEARQKISAAGMGRVVSIETRRKKSETRKAQMAADPSIAENLSKKLKGRVFSEEHLIRLREAQQRSFAENPERGRKIGSSNRGKTISAESNAKRSASLKARFATSEGKVALANRPRRPMTEETKRKIAAKALARHLANPEVLLAMSRKASRKSRA